MRLPVSRLARVTLGKMLQSEETSPADREADYLRAAHVQPDGRIVDLNDEQRMWFKPGELSLYSLRAGDVVIVEGGAGYGRSAVLTKDLPYWGFQNSIIRLRPLVGVADGRFLDYALQSALADGSIPLVCSTATIPHFTAEKVARFPLPAPPTHMQRAIADFLDRETAKIDALIKKQNELIGLLRERRLSTINFVFSQAPGMPGTPLRNAVAIQSGVTLGKAFGPEVHVKEYPYLRVANVQTGYIDTTDLATIELPPEVARQSLLRPGDVLITEGGDRAALARGSMWHGQVDPCLHQNHLYVLRPQPHLMIAGYLVYLLEGSDARAYFERTRRQTTNLSATNSSIVRAFRFTLPSVQVQEVLVDRLDEVTAKIDALIAKAEEFIALTRERRAALITAAVTGQIDVSGEAGRHGAA